MMGQNNMQKASSASPQSLLSKATIDRLIKTAKPFDGNPNGVEQATEFFDATNRFLQVKEQECDEVANRVQSFIPNIEKIKAENRVFNGEYNNEEELKGDLVGALRASAASGQMYAAIESADSGYNAANKNIIEYKEKIIEDGVKAAQEKIKITDRDRKYAADLTSKKNRNWALAGIIIFAILYILLQLFYYIYYYYINVPYIISRYIMPILMLIFLIISFCNSVIVLRNTPNKEEVKVNYICVLVGGICSIVFYVLQFILQYISTVLSAVVSVLWPAALIITISNAVIGFQRADIGRALVNKWYNEAIEYFNQNSFNLRSNLENQLTAKSFYINYIETSKKWLAYRESFDKQTSELRKKLDALCADFLKIIPTEFRDSKRLEALADLIETKRADDLKEACAVLEVKYREEARDEAMRARDEKMAEFFRAQDMYADWQCELLGGIEKCAIKAAKSSELQAIYAKEQARYAELQADMAIERTYATKRIAYAAEVSAAANKKAAEEAEKQRKFVEDKYKN